VAAIWAEVLGTDRVGIHDSFWDLGGHSLLATKVLVRLRRALGVDLPLQMLFEHPTLEAFATAVGHSVLFGHADEVDDLLAQVAELSADEVQVLLAAEASQGKE
jgi:acyl carrier protein